ncbi:Tripartite-type tricarboxylate transporter, receptor component TctC [Roseomonas rosea]|uniref:Tripartite-type tricarboxylate transporter, receptor component TctC n=1 Tax=Muricoccus roseus TaxID=198092 RepID=A0A1M6D2L9_9PROT|nr:tripartite tricarboxylate transporter substrate-binding protein [Roseomonas rosea]SHI67363.1 Tripartite-type tricarboxylate transporter, receptor component TctC [Roseomonas rosea]
MTQRRSLLPLLATPFVAGLARPASGQPAWPSRPVRVVVPFPPGGSNDAVARPLAEELQRALGQPFIVENKGGAGSTLGTAEVARAPADGHTLLVTSSTFATSAAVQSTPYDAGRDLAMVGLLATAPLVMLSGPDFPPGTMAEAIAYIRARPGKVDYGSAGMGSIGHMGGALFALKAGLDMQHVPYRGTGPVLNDMIANVIQLTFTTATAAAGLISGGRVKLLGWTSEDRPAAGPAAPTPRESGLPDYEAGIWWGLIGRRDIPEPIRARINAAVNTTLSGGRLATNLANEGATARPSSLEAGEGFLRQDLARWREVAQAANIRLE